MYFWLSQNLNVSNQKDYWRNLFNVFYGFRGTNHLKNKQISFREEPRLETSSWWLVFAHAAFEKNVLVQILC